MERFVKSLPHFKGSWILYSPMLALLPRKKRLVNLTFLHDKKTLFDVVLDVADPAQHTVATTQFEPGTALTIWSLLKEGDSFIDIGANFGLFSRIASKKLGENGMVFSIEPNPAAYKFLLEGAENNMFPMNVVASKSADLAFTLHKPWYRQTTAGRFLQTENGTIKSIKLDDLYNDKVIKNVTLIKIDTEGAEFLVLEGAKQLLQEYKPFVIAEVVPAYAKYFNYTVEELYVFMKNLGYSHFYEINDTAGSIKEIEIQGGEEGQILFASRALTEEDFNEVVIRKS